jgi:hypothetical protein
MRELANIFVLPPWAANPDVAPCYLSALRRLVNEFSESLPTAQLLLDNWHALEALRAKRPTATPVDPFRDFWPWYAEVHD